VSTTLSVVIPVYNEAKYLPATIEALVDGLAQPAFEAELVLVDDGSSDGSAEVARTAVADRLPIRIVTQPNRGRFEARRTALEQAVVKARADADVMAKAAGGSIGSAMEIMTSDPGFPRPVMYEASMMQARVASGGPETPIAVGEEKVSVTVTVRWQFIAAR